MPVAEHSHVSSLHGNSPGRANCRLNYTLEDRALQVHVLDKVKEARQQTITNYHADYLGLRGTQFNPSTVVTPSIIGKTKFSRTASDLVLAHELAPKHLSAKDCRTLSPGRLATWDRHTYHAFTRGDVITGWNHSTATGPRDLKQWLGALDTAAQRHTATTKHKLDASGVQFPTLRQREHAFAGALRQVKEAAAEQHRQLEARFGPEGAAMMESILAIKQPERKAVIRATRTDLEEVEALPAMGLMEE